MLTLLMWGVYIYLWIPLITLGAWLLGFEKFYEVMISYGGFAVALRLIDMYALMIIAIATCVLSWSGINYYRFHNRERRATTAVSNRRDISEFFGIPELELERVQASRRMEIDLDESGRIMAITHGNDGEGTKSSVIWLKNG